MDQRLLGAREARGSRLPRRQRVTDPASRAGVRLLRLRLGLADEGVERLVDRLLVTQWPDGGWNCDREGRFYGAGAGRRSLVDWGGANKRRTNPWVTVDALTVLTAAGRLPG